MAERKSGPVKPPIIDLTARPTEPVAAAETAPSAAPESLKPPVDPPKPSAQPAAPPPPRTAPARRPGVVVPAIAAGVGGAIVAIAICYGLAYAGFWPAGDSRLDALQQRLAATEAATSSGATAVADLKTRLESTEADLTGKLATTGKTLDALQQNLDKLGAAKPADLSPVEAELKTLTARLDAVAAGASSADAGALAANLAAVQQDLAALAGKITALDERAGKTDTNLQGLKTELDGARAAIDQAARAPSPKTIASAMQLPLLISALEADFAAGRPYAADLARLVAAVPETHVPASLSDAATAGLPAPGDLARALQAATPEMLAARPPSTASSWQGQLGDWVKGVLALRPQGEIAGDTPDALLSRLAGAVDRQDFAGATKLFDQLPAGMQQAAGDLGGKLKGLADADGFVAGLRTAALAPTTGDRS